MSFLCQLYTISSYLQPTSISNCTFPFEHILSSHSHLYSTLLTLLYMLPLLKQLLQVVSAYLGFDCFVCVFMIWLSCFVVCVFLCFGFLVAAGFLLFCRNSTSFPASPRITSGEQRNSKTTPLQTGSQEYQINHHPNAKTLQTISRACQMRKGYDNPGRVSFQLGLYFLCHAQILADLSNPSNERDRLRPSTPCPIALIIQQLLPTYMHHHELKLDSNKANLTAEGHQLDNLPVPSMPWRPCTDLCFLQLNINYRQIKSTQLNSASDPVW